MKKFFFMLFNSEKKEKFNRYHKNPFIGQCKRELSNVFEPDELTIGELLSDFDVLQIVGGSGCGKTSELFFIRNFLQKREISGLYFYCNSRIDLPDMPDEIPDFIIIDEAQRIKRELLLGILKITKKAGKKLVLGSHIDHSSWFLDDIKLKTIYLSTNYKRRLKSLVEKRLKSACKMGKPHLFTDEAMEKLGEESDFSMEKARAICYEIFLNDNIPDSIEPVIVAEAARKIDENSCVVFKPF